MTTESKGALQVLVNNTKQLYFNIDIEGFSKDDKEAIAILTNDLEVLEILEKHPNLDLSTLADYDDWDDYWDDWEGTTNELEIDEFKILKEWQEKAQNT